MGHHRLSRREVLESIVCLSGGSLLLPVSVGAGQTPPSTAPGVIRGKILDGGTGKATSAKMRVVRMQSSEPMFPVGAVRTMPKTAPKRYFYATGSYEVAVPAGFYSIESVRGISHEPVKTFTEVPPGVTREIDLTIPVLKDMQASGWYSGNTHTHYYYDLEEHPDDRLRVVPPAEALDVSIISYAIRNNSTYPTNRYPIGPLKDFSRGGTLIDMGEECRNDMGLTQHGYGHCMFINIPRLVEPVSTGLLSLDGKLPDFPTLSMLCEEARKLGGTTIWCHNGLGMELPVAVALGHIDAFNAADGLEADWKRYYQLLNCGFALPLSSGTDWWIYDHNRVFVRVEGGFTYAKWVAGLRSGRTFISNGPLLEFLVNGREPGATLSLEPGSRLRIEGRAWSRIPFDRLELVLDGEVVAEQSARDRSEAKLEVEIPVERGGWIALRTGSDAKTEAGYKVFAHTSALRFRVPGAPFRRSEAAGGFVDDIERSLALIRKLYRFSSEAERAAALGRFQEGRRAYGKIATGEGGL
jgi:hypothetical protein